jgi:lipopolysaccharide/colanic/teichoic acid biosynthesis glycosyltransferase
VPELEALPRYRERLLVGGLTGLAQVQLPADTDLQCARKLAHDLYYVEKHSFFLDHLASTAFKVIGLPFAVGKYLLALPGGRRLAGL